jgi:hypothetical protein
MSGQTLAPVLQGQDRTPVTGGPTARADGAAPGRPLRIQVRLRLRPEVSPSAMETAAARLPGVYAGSVLAGDHDLQLHLACRDAAEVTASIAALRRCGAAECQVDVVLRAFLYPQPRDTALPYQRTP